MWFLTDPVLSVLALLPIAVLLGAGHEAWHWLGGRAVGVPAIFRVSHRGVYLVFETDLSQIVTIPRRQRYGPFLAGMAFDSVVLAVALALRLAHSQAVITLNPTLDRMLGAIVLVLVVGIVWQWAAAFLHSDGYAVLANALHCHNLHRATWLTTKRRIWRLTDAEKAELSSISHHDRAVARWFGVVYLAGGFVMAWIFLRYGILLLLSMAMWIIDDLATLSWRHLAFWQSVAGLGYLLGVYGGPPLLALRERRLRRAGALR